MCRVVSEWIESCGFGSIASFRFFPCACVSEFTSDDDDDA